MATPWSRCAAGPSTLFLAALLLKALGAPFSSGWSRFFRSRPIALVGNHGLWSLCLPPFLLPLLHRARHPHPSGFGNSFPHSRARDCGSRQKWPLPVGHRVAELRVLREVLPAAEALLALDWHRGDRSRQAAAARPSSANRAERRVCSFPSVFSRARPGRSLRSTAVADRSQRDSRCIEMPGRCYCPWPESRKKRPKISSGTPGQLQTGVALWRISFVLSNCQRTRYSVSANCTMGVTSREASAPNTVRSLLRVASVGNDCGNSPRRGPAGFGGT